MFFQTYSSGVACFYTVYARIVQNTTNKLVLNCSIIGFASNPPAMDYDWTVNDALIPHPHEQLLAAASLHSADELVSNSKFNVSLVGTELSLTVHNPSMFTGMFFFLFVCI